MASTKSMIKIRSKQILHQLLIAAILSLNAFLIFLPRPLKLSRLPPGQLNRSSKSTYIEFNSPTFRFHSDSLSSIDLSSINITIASEMVTFYTSMSSIKANRTTPTDLLFQLEVYVAGPFKVRIFSSSFVLFDSTVTFKPNKSVPYTTFVCHGDDFPSRWCEVTNMCVGNTSLYFSSPYPAIPETNFINVGARPPPDDRSPLRFTSSNVFFSKELPDSEWVEDLTIMTLRSMNNMMIWHNLMDGTLPLYWTIRTVFGNESYLVDNHSDTTYGPADQNVVLAYLDPESRYNLYYMKLLSNKPPLFDFYHYQAICFRKAVLGVRKTEFHPRINRAARSKITMPYEADRDGIAGLRDTMLTRIGVENPPSPDLKKPLLLIVKRKNEDLKRQLLNSDDVFNVTKEECPFCDVQEVDFQAYDKYGQMRKACNASAIIGMHGSGLTHAAWLHQSSDENPTSLVEIFPYLYTCRQWYNQMCTIFGLDYYKVYTDDISQSRWDSWHNPDKVRECHNNATNTCIIGKCHDFLRDQSVIVDIPKYRAVIRQLAEKLRRARKAAGLE